MKNGCKNVRFWVARPILETIFFLALQNAQKFCLRRRKWIILEDLRLQSLQRFKNHHIQRLKFKNRCPRLQKIIKISDFLLFSQVRVSTRYEYEVRGQKQGWYEVRVRVRGQKKRWYEVRVRVRAKKWGRYEVRVRVRGQKK